MIQRRAYPQESARGNYDSVGSLEEINNELDSNMNDILKLFDRRRQLIQFKKKALAEDYVRRQETIKRARVEELVHELKQSADKEMLVLLTNLQAYSRYKSLMSSIWTQNVNTLSKSESNKSRDFWDKNKALETEVDTTLKRLKSCDQTIQKIVNEEYETCTTIDEIEQKMRQILRKKEHDHIKKAQPLSKEKTKLLDELQVRQSERERIKDEKRQVIKRILNLLENLKNIREERANSVVGLLHGAQFDLRSYDDFVSTIEIIAKSRQGLEQFQQKQGDIEQELEIAYQKILEITEIFKEKQSDEARLFAELNGSYRARVKLLTMEKIFTADTLPEGATKNLPELLKKCRQYRKILETALGQENSVKVGLSRTKQTIEAFDRVLKSIDSQKQRRQRLLMQLEKIQQHHSLLMKQEDHKREMLLEIENLKNRRRSLQKLLNELVTEADLSGYKQTTAQISEVDREIQRKQDQFDLLSHKLVTSQRELIGFTNSIKSDFSDILNEVVPNSWMKNHDLKKFENIFQLNVYLKRTFKRLNL